MKKNLSLIIIASLILCSCSQIWNTSDNNTTPEKPLPETNIPAAPIIAPEEFAKPVVDSELSTKLAILHHYGLDFIGNTFEIDSKEKCLSVIRKYQNITNTVDCSANFSGKEFWNLWFWIYEKWNNYYQIFLWENDLWWMRFVDDYYNPASGTSFDWKYPTGNNLGFISMPSELTGFTIKSKQASLFKNTLNLYITMTNKKIGDFSMNINYKIKEGIDPKELIMFLQWDFPYELNLEHEDTVWMGDAYKLLQTSSKKLEIFGKSANYFADSWWSDISADIFITSTFTPTNRYFSEVVIYLLDTEAYNNKEKENIVRWLLRDLKWRDTFLFD